MARQYRDQTLLDNQRRLLNFQRPEIKQVLPDFFPEEYPNLIKLFEKYYEWMDSDGNPNEQIRRLYRNRDATQVPDTLLEFLEDELLLGNAYFGGFKNKREAIKFSNTLYRSKGTKYSIQQFFRGFFGVDPDVIYTKDRIFQVGPQIDYELDSNNSAGGQVKVNASVLGPESQKFLTDDKLYQQMALLIKTDISIRDWLDVYKLFAHPGGIYIGSEILLVSENTDVIDYIQDEIGDPIKEAVVVEGVAPFAVQSFADQSLLIDSDGVTKRMTATQFLSAFSDAVVDSYGAGFLDMRELLSDNAPSFDDSTHSAAAEIRDHPLMSDSSLDASVGNHGVELIKFSFDQHVFDSVYDSDSA